MSVKELCTFQIGFVPTGLLISQITSYREGAEKLLGSVFWKNSAQFFSPSTQAARCVTASTCALIVQQGT